MFSLLTKFQDSMSLRRQHTDTVINGRLQNKPGRPITLPAIKPVNPFSQHCPFFSPDPLKGDVGYEDYGKVKSGKRTCFHASALQISECVCQCLQCFKNIVKTKSVCLFLFIQRKKNAVLHRSFVFGLSTCLSVFQLFCQKL